LAQRPCQAFYLCSILLDNEDPDVYTEYYIGVRGDMLELRRVSKVFAGIPAVDDVSFSAQPGEVTGYLGPSGSGKSTTMKMIRDFWS